MTKFSKEKLASYNTKFEKQDFISGSVKPLQSDLQLYLAFEEPPSEDEYPFLNKWYKSIGHFKESGELKFKTIVDKGCVESGKEYPKIYNVNK